MKKITNIRVLALAINKAAVSCELIGKGLNKRIDLWISRDEAFIKDGWNSS